MDPREADRSLLRADGEGAVVTSSIDVRALLDSPPWSSDRALQAILDSLLRQRKIDLPDEVVDPASLWPPSSFGLDRVTAFVAASSERQQEIVRRCAKQRLGEALSIEKLGLAFCAKMTLLAETTEERMLYALIAADEAMHFHWISRFAEETDARAPFLEFLSDIVEQGSQAALTMLVQVVLEGWGVHHYRSLAHDCMHPALREVLGRVVIDESRHHGSGERLMRRRSVTAREREAIVRALQRLLDMVRCGPQAVVAAIAPPNRVLAFEQLGGDDTSAKLELLRSLIASAAIEGLVDELDFTPMNPTECAACSIS